MEVVDRVSEWNESEWKFHLIILAVKWSIRLQKWFLLKKGYNFMLSRMKKNKFY